MVIFSFSQSPFENGEDAYTVDLPMCLADMLFHSSPLGGTHQQQHFAEESPAQLSSFVHSGTELLDCCFRIHIFDLLKFIHIYISLTDTHYIYIYTEYIEENIHIHRHTTTHLHFCATVFLSCQRNTHLHLEQGAHVFLQL